MIGKVDNDVNIAFNLSFVVQDNIVTGLTKGYPSIVIHDGLPYGSPPIVATITEVSPGW